MIWTKAEHSVFNKRTYSAFGAITRAAEARYWSVTHKNQRLRGKIRRPGVPVEFDLAEFRAWVWAQFQVTPASALPCPYCGEGITVHDFAIDHKIPGSKSRRPRHALDNLCLCCRQCNEAKGILTDDEFKWLRKILFAGLRKEAVEYILRSLRIAEVQRQSFFRSNKQKGGGKSNHERPATLPTS